MRVEKSLVNELYNAVWCLSNIVLSKLSSKSDIFFNTSSNCACPTTWSISDLSFDNSDKTLLFASNDDFPCSSVWLWMSSLIFLDTATSSLLASCMIFNFDSSILHFSENTFKASSASFIKKVLVSISTGYVAIFIQKEKYSLKIVSSLGFWQNKFLPTI